MQSHEPGRQRHAQQGQERCGRASGLIRIPVRWQRWKARWCMHLTGSRDKTEVLKIITFSSRSSPSKPAAAHASLVSTAVLCPPNSSILVRSSELHSRDLQFAALPPRLTPSSLTLWHQDFVPLLFCTRKRFAAAKRLTGNSAYTQQL